MVASKGLQRNGRSAKTTPGKAEAEEMQNLTTDIEAPHSEVKPHPHPGVEPEPAMPTAEELLKQAKAQTNAHKQESVEEPDQGEGSEFPPSAIAQSAKSEIETAVAEQAEALVEAEKQARQTYTEAGITKGLKAAGVIRQGFQIGLLTGLTEATKTDAKELVEQLELLDVHIDAESTDSTKNLLEQLGVSKPKPKEADEEIPFRSEAIAKNVIQSQGKFNILNKGAKK
ncbi:hypothetical protein H6G96_32565 [Nostoc sp. FACHB-892]|uniref:hypothetical protein n=1 Tax=Nostoc sp. FACHB-892 TaxID=2692843 RepID=UPI0016848D76|nr:hypothetical protein [Nostoc sp. FACHB-892]MBD2730926.1 hypothetical protein [Nostoc sp. FACHB-892]